MKGKIVCKKSVVMEENDVVDFTQGMEYEVSLVIMNERLYLYAKDNQLSTHLIFTTTIDPADVEYLNEHFESLN